MRTQITNGRNTGMEGIAKQDDEIPEEYVVDLLNPDGSVYEYGVFYGDHEFKKL